MNLRRNQAEIAAYAVSAAALSAVGRGFLPHGFDGLSSLTAEFSPLSVLVWASAVTATLAAVGLLLRRRDWLFHAPTALCFGLGAADAPPDPRIDRIEPILAELPGWPWLFAIETVLWAGFISLGTWAAAKVALSGRKPAWDSSVSEAVWPPADVPAAEKVSRADLEQTRRAMLDLAGDGGASETGSDVRVARKLTPLMVQGAQAGALAAGLVMLFVLLRSESYKQAVFAEWMGFWLAGSLALGFWPVGMPWRVMFLPAGLGVVVYIFADLTGVGSQLDRFEMLSRPAMFGLPIDYAAVGGLGMLMATRTGGFQDFWWSITCGAVSLWNRAREAATGTGAAPASPGGRLGRPSAVPAGAPAPEKVASAAPAGEADKKGRSKKRKKR